MDWVALIYAACALISAFAAVLAWVAKLRWSKEFAAAKDEIIKAKEAEIAALNSQIDLLRELTPMKVREYFLSVKTQLEEYNAYLSEQLLEAKQEIMQLESTKLLAGQAAEDANERINQLLAEKANLEEEVRRVESKLNKSTEAEKLVASFYSGESFELDKLKEAIARGQIKIVKARRS